MSRSILKLPIPWLKLVARFWPPFLGAGIRITKMTEDYREFETSLKLHWYNRNPFKTHFGGNLYSMADPFFVICLMQNIGDDHYVWDKSAYIEFLKPGKSEVRASCTITEEELKKIVDIAGDGKAHCFDFSMDIKDLEGTIISRMTKTVYVKRKPAKKD